MRELIRKIDIAIEQAWDATGDEELTARAAAMTVLAAMHTWEHPISGERLPVNLLLDFAMDTGITVLGETR